MFCISARSVVNAVPGFWPAVDGFNPASANREGQDLGFFRLSVSPRRFYFPGIRGMRDAGISKKGNEEKNPKPKHKHLQEDSKYQAESNAL